MDAIERFRGRTAKDNWTPQAWNPRVRWSRAQLSAVLDLCRLPYWRRVWITQELYLAKKITLYYGSKTLTWETLDSLGWGVWDMDIEGYPGDKLIVPTAAVQNSDAQKILGARERWRKRDDVGFRSTPQLLARLLEACRNRESTDIRDRVFGLLGLVEDAMRNSSRCPIVADYSLSVQEIFVKVYDYFELAAKAELRTSRPGEGGMPDVSNQEMLGRNQVYYISLLRDSLRLPSNDETLRRTIARTCGQGRYRDYRRLGNWRRQDVRNNVPRGADPDSYMPGIAPSHGNRSSSSRPPSTDFGSDMVYHEPMEKRVKGKGVLSWFKSLAK